jgi:hypothetical protein
LLRCCCCMELGYMAQFPQPTLTWEFLLGFAETWRLWVPLLLLLIWVGWLTRRWWSGRLLLVSLLCLFIFAIAMTWREARIRQSRIDAWNALRTPLPEAKEIDGLQLAAGTVVRWDQEHEGHLLTAELGGGQTVAPAVTLSGEVSRMYIGWWRGRLVRDSVIRGWSCAAGEVDVYTSGQLRWCLLSRPRKLPLGEIPAGTAVLLDMSGPGDALLHLPKTGMLVSPGDVWIVPGEWFVVSADGKLKSLPRP